MLITLYSFSKRKNSTKQPITGTQVGVNLKSPTSKYNPTFIIGNINPLSYTYLKWEDRYYYIDDIRFIRDHYYELVCSLDVLATYKSNILATSAYVAYSSSNYNVNLLDTRISSVTTATTQTSSSVLFDDFLTSGGTYIVSYLTDKPTVGASGVVWLDQSGCNSLAETLSTEGFNSYLSDLSKQMQGAYDSLLSCLVVPFNWYAGTTAATEIHLGSYTGPFGKIPTEGETYNCLVDIPWQYSDFRNSSLYTSLLLYLPCYGLVELNANDFIGKTQIHIKCTIDGITGIGVYHVGNVFKGNCTFATSYPIGTSHRNSLQQLDNAISLASSFATNNYLGVASSLINGIILDQKRTYGQVGTANGGVLVKSSIIPDPSRVVCITITHKTNVEPSTFTSSLGRPCNQVISLSSLTGYVQTVNASVSIPNSIYATEVNNLLNGGVYIE